MIKVGDLVKYSGPDGDIGIAVVVNIHAAGEKNHKGTSNKLFETWL